MNVKKILYSFLKEMKTGNKVDYTNYDITQEEFATIVEYAIQENYIKNAGVSRGGIDNSVKSIRLFNARLTFEGEDYLHENRALAKGYKGLKEVREWLPL